MGITLRADRLSWELARRGWGNGDLARASGLSYPTVGAALAGRRVSPRTVRRIAAALTGAAPIEGADQLLPPRE